jgi:hypothetical protein
VAGAMEFAGAIRDAKKFFELIRDLAGAPYA